jgi:FG-GAP-like repeat/Right handed beta helix region/RTX calcium-binding nonapeptide repeat (4 copies)/FG-GAP repeat
MPLPVTLLDASNTPIGSFSTIQAAVNAAANGDTIQVAPGTYTEQVTVNGLTSLTIEGTGADPSQTVILSPTVLTSNIQNPGEFHTFTDALVGAENGASVTIKNLTVNGNNQGVVYATGANGGGDLIGIEGVNASLTVMNVHVTGTEDVEGGVVQGGQGNKGIVVNDTNSSTQTLTVTGSTVDNFQKAGILAEGTGLTATINNNTVTGVGTNPINLSQNLVELASGAAGSITQNQITGVSDAAGGANGVLIFKSGSGVTVSNNTVSGFAGNVNSAGIYFAGVDAPTAEGNTISGQGFALSDDGSFGAFNTALVQDTNTYTSDALNYYFFPGPTTTNAWTVTGTGGPDDIEGGANNDVFAVMGGAPNGNVFVGNGGIDTVQGYGAGYHVAIQSNQWVVTNGTVTDTLTGIEKVVINGQTYDLVDNQGQDVGGFQTLQSAINAAQPGDVVVTAIGSASVTVGVDNLTFEPLQAATGITLTLASTGVHTVTLADYAPGQGTAVTVVGNDLGDTLRGNDGGDTLTGGAGNDTISGGTGVDTLSGGGGANVFKSTALGLNGDTITDLERGDTIVITDADPAHFSFHVSGTTLSFDPNTAASATFDTVTLANAPTLAFSVTADPVSGVDLHLGALPPYDFNGDGKSDLLFQNTNATPQIWLMNGTSVISKTSLIQPPPQWKIVGSGDFNGDGEADILWINTASNQPAIWEMNGTSIISAVGLPAPPASWRIAGIGDFYGTGDADILWQNTNGAATIWEMNGTSIVNNTPLTMPPAGLKVVATGDFNGDGKSDILFINTLTNAPTIWEMNGTSIIGQATLAAPPPQWEIVGTGDFNGDGDADILWLNTVSNQASIWEMNGLSVVSAVGLPAPPPVWRLVGTSDVNGDGKADLLWQNTNDGTVTVWEMNGTSIAVNTPVGTPGVSWILNNNDPPLPAATPPGASSFTVTSPIVSSLTIVNSAATIVNSAAVNLSMPDTANGNGGTMHLSAPDTANGNGGTMHMSMPDGANGNAVLGPPTMSFAGGSWPANLLWQDPVPGVGGGVPSQSPLIGGTTVANSMYIRSG